MSEGSDPTEGSVPTEALARLEAMRRGLTDEQVTEEQHRALGGEELSGVSLQQYATVVAARGDGLPLEATLAFAGVAPEGWAAAERLWRRRLLQDLAHDARMTEALEFFRGQALLRWPRPLSPIDSDVQSWLDFERAYMLAVDDRAFLDERGMTRNDIVRLQVLWRTKLEDDEQRAAAIASLSEPAGEVPDVAPEPASLAPPTARLA